MLATSVPKSNRVFCTNKKRPAAGLLPADITKFLSKMENERASGGRQNEGDAETAGHGGCGGNDVADARLLHL